MAVVECEIRDGIAWFTLNRPERLNALNEEVSQSIRDLCRSLDKDDSARVVIVTGKGARAFSSGFDLKSGRKPPAGAEVIGEDAEYAPWSLLKVRKPTIAAIRGYALAGGLDLALACDIRIATPDAQLGFPEVHWNLPDGFAVALLSKIVGAGHGMDLILRAQRIDAEHALRIGLVNEVVPVERLLSRCEEMAKQLAAQAPLAQRAMKEMAYVSLYANLEQVMSMQGKYMRLLAMTEDGTEGRRAFPERRQPQYRGQ